MSKGEDKIVDLLNIMGVKYVREKTFSDLKHGLYRYDFYLPNYDGGRVIIEFNGEQHYHYIGRFFRNRQDFMKAQAHDRQKISYALANGIKIYVIPFWEIDKITDGRQLFQKKYLATSRWKNDEDAKNSPLHKKE